MLVFKRNQRIRQPGRFGQELEGYLAIGKKLEYFIWNPYAEPVGDWVLFYRKAGSHDDWRKYQDPITAHGKTRSFAEMRRVCNAMDDQL